MSNKLSEVLIIFLKVVLIPLDIFLLITAETLLVYLTITRFDSLSPLAQVLLVLANILTIIGTIIGTYALLDTFSLVENI